METGGVGLQQALRKAHNESTPYGVSSLHNGPLTPQHALIGFTPAPLTQAPCTPALAHTSSLDTDRTRNARAPTSPRSTGFCAIWLCKSEFEFALLLFLKTTTRDTVAFDANVCGIDKEPIEVQTKFPAEYALFSCGVSAPVEVMLGVIKKLPPYALQLGGN